MMYDLNVNFNVFPHSLLIESTTVGLGFETTFLHLLIDYVYSG